MTFELPKKHFAEKPSDNYLCPNCRKGYLEPVLESFSQIEPKHSEAAKAAEEWDPDWIDYRFRFECRCNLNSCGEISYVTGNGTVDQRYSYSGEPEWYERFRIKSFFPAPYLIPIPDGTPSKVWETLEKSFSLYWVDISAAANALRASLEYLLDELKVPRSQKGSDGATKRLWLHDRIGLATKQLPDFSELFLALKDIGNLGSHGGDVKASQFSDALEIFSHVLIQLYQNDASRMKELAKKLRSDISNKK